MERTVFVIDDDQAARESLTFLLRTEGITCRAYGSAAAFLQQLQPIQQGCIVTDVRMPGMDGISLVHRLHEIGCRMPIVVITGHADVPLAVQAMKAGVADFIEKPFESDTILAAIRRCLELSRQSEVQETQRTIIERRRASLTGREGQVCVAIVDGLSNKEAALSLNISPRTVEIYRANVMAKMQAGSVSELVRMLLMSNAA